MTKKLSKKQTTSQWSSQSETTSSSGSSSSLATNSPDTPAYISLLVVVVTIFTGYFVGKCIASFTFIQSILSPKLTSLSIRHRFEFTEQNAVRVQDDLPMLFLKEKNEPLILLDTYISKEVPRWTSTDIADLLSTPVISGVYRSDDSSIFGTYYDNNRPMRTLPNIHNNIRYEDDIELDAQGIKDAFPPNATASKAPYYILATSLAAIDPTLEKRMDFKELISLNPAKSSVNLWMSSPGSITPCHFDGYYNMYVYALADVFVFC